MNLNELDESAVATIDRKIIDENNLNLDIQTIQLDSEISSNITDGVTATGCCKPTRV
ncbi:hypothetical protein [Oenococcus oeni]|uniref:hypothetical protein n=1 Tax=Oenococcus oeni TaxID=1247 RepID=UPI000A7718F2|nr:hypothetical protein [Oenococcus oeni]